jgi:hypothetical protein
MIEKTSKDDQEKGGKSREKGSKTFLCRAVSLLSPFRCDEVVKTEAGHKMHRKHKSNALKT